MYEHTKEFNLEQCKYKDGEVFNMLNELFWHVSLIYSFRQEKNPIECLFGTSLHCEHLLNILDLGFGTNSKEEKYFSLYSCIHIW